MFKASISNAKSFKDVLSAIATLIDEATFEITPEKISLREMDPSRVAMVDFEWPKTLFEEFECAESTKICINLSEFLKLLKRTRKDDSIELRLDEKTGRLSLRLMGRYTRAFNMPTLEATIEEVPTPKIEFNVKAKVTTDGLKEAIEDSSLVSDNVQIEAEEERLVFSAKGDIMGATIEMKKGSDVLLEIMVKEPSKATFSLNYLSDIVKAASATAELVTLEFSSNMPIKLDFHQIEGGKLVYYLAPRIEA